MKYKILLIFLFVSSLIVKAQGSDSIKINDKVESASKIEQTSHTDIKKPNSESRADKYIIALIGLFGIILASVISYRIANKQNRNKLLETKIKFLTSQKEKLENIKSQVYDRVVDVSDNSNFNADLIRSKFVDRLLKDITSVQKHSELFDDEFIEDLNSYSQRISGYIFQAKSGANLENNGTIKTEMTDFNNVPIYDEKIKSIINQKIKDFDTRINELIDR